MDRYECKFNYKINKRVHLFDGAFKAIVRFRSLHKRELFETVYPILNKINDKTLIILKYRLMTVLIYASLLGAKGGVERLKLQSSLYYSSPLQTVSHTTIKRVSMAIHRYCMREMIKIYRRTRKDR